MLVYKINISSCSWLFQQVKTCHGLNRCSHPAAALHFTLQAAANQAEGSCHVKKKVYSLGLGS